MPKAHLTLSEPERKELREKLRRNGLRSKVFKRVTALPELDKGKTMGAVRDELGICYPTIAKLIRRYEQEGLGCLTDKKQPGRPPLTDGKQRALITALACSEAPDGHARWSLRLLAEKIVELDYCETISHEHVSRILKKTN